MPAFDLSLPELQQYRPQIDEPDDLDEFWSTTLAEARGHDGAPDLARASTGLTSVEVDDVTFPGFAGDPVRAWLARPAGAAGALPVVVELIGYGRGRGLPHEHLTWASAGYAHLVVDTRGQGSGSGSGGDTADPHGSGPAVPGFLTRGVGDPRDHYYRRAVTDAVRAVDAARGIDGLDPDRVAVTGISQGGGMALAVAGLVPDLAAVMPDVPFLCHFRRAVEITGRSPYTEVATYLSVHRDQVETVFRTLSYVDAATLCTRAQAPTLFSVALMDETCPPSTVYAAYNRYGERAAGPVGRHIDVYPFNDHEGGQEYRFPRQLAWLGEVLG